VMGGVLIYVEFRRPAVPRRGPEGGLSLVLPRSNNPIIQASTRFESNLPRPFTKKLRSDLQKNRSLLRQKIFNTQKIPQPLLSFTLNFK